jgi:hypothetical protein
MTLGNMRELGVHHLTAVASTAQAAHHCFRFQG